MTFAALLLALGAGPAIRVAGGDYPLNLVEAAGRYLVSTNNGYGKQYLQSYDTAERRVTGKLELPSLWFGLAYDSEGGRLLASDGKNGVYAIPFEDGVFGRARLVEIPGCKLTAGLAVRNSHAAAVACNQSHEIVGFDPASGTVRARLRVGEFPFEVTALPGNRLAVSNWGSSSIAFVDGSHLTKIAEVAVGSHPNQMLAVDQEHLAVSSSDSDSVSLVSLSDLREIRRIDLRPPGSKLRGVQPDALAYDRGRLFVALAAVSGVAVFRVEPEDGFDVRLEGVIPAGAFPSALCYSEAAKTLFIANARNTVTGPNADARPYRYIGEILGGGIEALTDAQFDSYRPRLESLAERIYGNGKKAAPVPPRHPPIRYLFYVIKENRTYDQVLGDMPEGNGRPDLVLFGEKVTPNHHALAREYILFDNFFVNGDVSADGHLWSTAGTSTEYVNRLWPMEYSKRTAGALDAPYEGDAAHDSPVSVPAAGFLWDRLIAAGISFRNYGEWYSHEDGDPSKIQVYLRGLKNHSDLNYRDDIGGVTDQQRADEWEREFGEFESNGQLPRFSLIYLPNDHTVGTRPGSPTPRAMVADNDLALGRIVERISKSRYWPQSAIFVLEDDAQDGPDHVDAHRSPMLILSPYTRRHAVSHARYSTISVIKTMSQLLGTGPLTYLDDRAPSLLGEFAGKASLDAYVRKRPEVSLDERNRPDAPGAKESARWDFRGPDRAPWLDLNRVIWKSIKGADSEPPAPVLRVGVGYD